ncbi:hypothetical protein CC80DRAFT_566914 [Byssothecium circinans]|uniref:Uncharacterized protein n=1 Tax=Byssothecium circinans TaxID=147558 RepID=A0A6A5TQG4_9PLEO|nr:hypothetical protein CC80DRAFT_566914 [Byssothecium circinans]
MSSSKRTVSWTNAPPGIPFFEVVVTYDAEEDSSKIEAEFLQPDYEIEEKRINEEISRLEERTKHPYTDAEREQGQLESDTVAISHLERELFSEDYRLESSESIGKMVNFLSTDLTTVYIQSVREDGKNYRAAVWNGKNDKGQLFREVKGPGGHGNALASLEEKLKQELLEKFPIVGYGAEVEKITEHRLRVHENVLIEHPLSDEGTIEWTGGYRYDIMRSGPVEGKNKVLLAISELFGNQYTMSMLRHLFPSTNEATSDQSQPGVSVCTKYFISCVKEPTGCYSAVHEMHKNSIRKPRLWRPANGKSLEEELSALSEDVANGLAN